MAERETLWHGGLTVVTERQPDGRIVVTIVATNENVTVAWQDPTPADPDAADFREFTDTWCNGDPWRASAQLMRGGLSNGRASELRRGYFAGLGADNCA